MNTVTISVGQNPDAVCYNTTNNKIYYANGTDGTVTIINAATSAVITTLTTGAGSYYLCYNPTNNKVYCANSNTTTVSIIDGAADTVITNITVGDNPAGFVYNLTGNKVYCAISGDDNVVVINGSTNGIITTIACGSGAAPQALCHNTTNNKVYSANPGNDTISIIDGSTDILITNITLVSGSYPNDICYNPTDNKVYSANTYGPSVTIINGVTNIEIANITNVNLTAPFNLSYCPISDKVYCTNYEIGGLITIIGGVTDNITGNVTPSGDEPMAICYNNTNNQMFVTSHSDSNVSIVDCVGESVIDTVIVGGSPESDCFDSTDNKVFTSNWNDGTVTEIDAGGGGPVTNTILHTTDSLLFIFNPKVVFLPEMSGTFERMKSYLDNYVYDNKPSAEWKLNNITVSGSGFAPTDIVRIMVRRGESESNTTLSTPDGTFVNSVGDLPYDETAYVEVYRNEVFVGSTVIDQYYYLAIIYLLSLEFIRIYEQIAHGKQDIFIYPTLSTMVETAQDYFTTDIAGFSNIWSGIGGLEYYKNQKGVYSSSRESLRDKLTLPIPGDVYGRDPEDVVKQSIIVSEKGPVMNAINFLQDIYSLVGVEKIFVYPLEFSSTFNVGLPLSGDWIPRVYIDNPLMIEFPANGIIRYGWQVLPICGDTFELVDLSGYEAQMTPGGEDLYVWVYIDGVINFANALEKKHSTIQPTPEVKSVTIQVSQSDVEVDDSTGSITGIPYQAYAYLALGEFEHPVFAVSSGVTAVGVNSAVVYKDTKFVKRDLVGFGVCTVTEDINVTYNEYTYNRHLCVARLTWNVWDDHPHIAALHRLWNLPGHIRSGSVDGLSGVQIFIKFADVPVGVVVADIVKSIALIIREIVPIVSDYMPYINVDRDDQEIMDEDGILWPEQFKGYQWIGTLVDPSEFTPQEGTR